MSNKDKFLQIIKEFDENYCIDQEMKEYIIVENNTYKQSCIIKKYPLQHYSQIDFQKMKHLCNSTKIFKSFYTLSDTQIDIFVHILNRTNLFLKYYDKYQWNNLRTEKERKALQKHYLKVIEDLETITDEKTMEILKTRSKGLDKKLTITERKIFENLLFFMKLLFNKQTPLTDKTINTVNDIIKSYFDKDITFSRKIDVNRFTEYHYTVETQQDIKLYHS
jgi:hypothetical protein